MNRVDKFNKKWVKETTDTIELAEKHLREKMEEREWYHEIPGASDLIYKAGMDSVGMAVTHEGFILLQKVIQDTISKTIAEQLPPLIREAIREELLDMIESNKKSKVESQPNKKPKIKKKKYKNVEVISPEDKKAGFRLFKIKEDLDKLVDVLKTHTGADGIVSNKTIRFLMEVEYKIVIPPNNSSQILKICMEKDTNIEKVGRGQYRYRTAD